VLALCAALALGAGCAKRQGAGQSASPPPQAAGPKATPIPVPALTAAQTAAAKRPGGRSGVSIDVFDVRPDGSPNPGGITVGTEDTVHVLGWAYAESAHAPCSAVALVVDGNRVVASSYGYARSDVAAFYKDPGHANVGYTGQIPAASLGSGTHAVEVVCIGVNGARSGPRAMSVTVR
jgi:hypothetical protein